MRWHRVRVEDKIAFREDLQVDPTLTDLQKRMISVIATHWDNTKMHAECSLTFIARGAGTTKKMVHKYAASLTASGRVSVKREATYTTSTLWAVNWWFRGSPMTRENNGGRPVFDCRKVSPSITHGESPTDAQGESPKTSSPPELAVPRVGDQFLPKGSDIAAPVERAPIGRTQVAAKKKKENPHRAPPGFAKWRIVHAEYEGEDGETFVAHLRSGKARKFVLRCHVDSDDYESIDRALFIDGEPDAAIGELICMSTNRTGAKAFLRAAPLPWVDATILSGEEREDGGANIRVSFNDHFSGEGKLTLAAADAADLLAACGGEAETIGARVRYRLLPDDRMEFQLMEAPALEAA